MKVVKNGNTFRILKDGAEFFDTLPIGSYVIRFDDITKIAVERGIF